MSQIILNMDDGLLDKISRLESQIRLSDDRANSFEETIKIIERFLEDSHQIEGGKSYKDEFKEWVKEKDYFMLEEFSRIKYVRYK